MTPTTARREQDAGSVLLIALLVTLIVLGIGLTAMWLASSGTRISGNLTRRQEALYAAETGIERAQALLRARADWATLLRGGDGSLCTPTVTSYVPGKGLVLCDGATPLENVFFVTGSSAASSDPRTAQMAHNLRYTVYVRNDDVEYQWCNGTNEPGEPAGADTGDCDGDGSGGTAADLDLQRFGDHDRRVVLRAEGVGRDGLSQLAIEATVGAAVTAPVRASYGQKGGSGQGHNAVPRAAIPRP